MTRAESRGATNASTRTSGLAREGHVEISQELCKGCEFCVDVCPEECLAMAELINSRGFRFAQYEGERCTGCGVCYYNCPEPGAIIVTRSGSDREES